MKSLDSLLPNTLAILGLIFTVVYIFRKLFYGGKWFKEVISKNETEAKKASHKAVDRVSLFLMVGALLCAAIYAWLYMI